MVFKRSKNIISSFLFRNYELINLIAEIMFVLLVVGKIYLVLAAQNAFREDIADAFSKEAILMAGLYDGQFENKLSPVYLKSINDALVKYTGSYQARCLSKQGQVTLEFFGRTNNGVAIKELVDNETSKNATTLTGQSCFRDKIIKEEGMLKEITRNEDFQFAVDLLVFILMSLLIFIKIHHYILTKKFISVKYLSSTPKEYR